MSRIPALTNSLSPAPASRGTNDLKKLDMDQFLNLLIVELQNQDPLNPMDNVQLLQQLSQIREISATGVLTDTLHSVLHGQNFATASALIGREISALGDDNANIRGVVDRVSMERDSEDETKQTIRVHVGQKSIKLDNIREILK